MRKYALLVLLVATMILAPLAGIAGAGGNPCPPASPNKGATPPNCGNGNGGNGGKTCPESSPNHGGEPPCGNTGGDDGGGSTCGPADQGGVSPGGKISGPLWDLGGMIATDGAAGLGDAVQSGACAASELLGV
jgi:hypothetical protein